MSEFIHLDEAFAVRREHGLSPQTLVYDHEHT
jgi:hypothetical protein